MVELSNRVRKHRKPYNSCMGFLHGCIRVLEIGKAKYTTLKWHWLCKWSYEGGRFSTYSAKLPLRSHRPNYCNNFASFGVTHVHMTNYNTNKDKRPHGNHRFWWKSHGMDVVGPIERFSPEITQGRGETPILLVIGRNILVCTCGVCKKRQIHNDELVLLLRCPWKPCTTEMGSHMEMGSHLLHQFFCSFFLAFSLVFYFLKH
jgi:hypothetical protein